MSTARKPARKSPTPKSPAYVLVAHVREHQQKATARSSDRWYRTMSEALCLAITAGLRFAENDVADIAKDLHLGAHEGHFQTAVEFGNVSACVSYEKWVGRSPFVFGGRRLHQGSILPWRDLPQVKVTSFSGDTMIVCSYREKERSGRDTVERRITVTAKELRQAEKGRKEANREAQAVAEICEELRRHQWAVPPAVVVTWSVEQRAEATEYLKGGFYRDGVWHERELPAFVKEAAIDAAWDAALAYEAELAEVQRILHGDPGEEGARGAEA